MKTDIYGETFLKCVLTWLCCLPGRQGMTILEGNPAEFNCTVETLQTSLWQVKRPDGTFEAIAQNGVLYSHYREKFQLEIQNELSGNNTSYFQTLTLDEVTVDDDGQYRCEEEGQIRTVTNLTVEIPPVLQLKRENLTVSTDMDVVFNEQVTITCIAEGGKPPVRLSWKVNGQEKTGPFIGNSPPSRDRRVTSVIYYQPTLDDNRLTCVASGQQVIPEQEISVDINVQYILNCLIVITNETNAFIITCSCEANPEVEKYMIYVNKTLFSENQEAKLPSEKGATVFCIATNKVANYTTKEVELKPFHEEVPAHVTRFALIICLFVAGMVVVIVVIVAVVCICRKMKDVDKAEAHATEAREEATRFEMSQKTFLELAMKPLPDDYGLEQDDHQPLKDCDKGTEEKPDKEERSKKPHEEEDGLDMTKAAAEMAMKPLPDDDDSEQNKLNRHKNIERRKF
ncbi:Immunoglobulin superfamily member 5 [Holothuria leucospilota]|uniref:Immunoglobulin superfamily member 5 n=1 Tax=Holothuria leucospilota TaxID=206669 RepID=A0A9Q0YA39_HOLLE|nr:Immunoglobulin superfamily member 5 [Holothuria leucospilota]